jgi:hypothetical protein
MPSVSRQPPEAPDDACVAVARTRLLTETVDVSCCGNVYKKTLAPGRYAFVVDDPRVGQPGIPPVSIAVVDVQP